MDYLKQKRTTEDEVRSNWGMDFIPFVINCKNSGMTQVEIAEMAGCSKTNLRRILYKYNYKFRRGSFSTQN
jgi:hypothetical protein